MLSSKIIGPLIAFTLAALFVGGLYFLLKQERERGDLGDHYFYLSEYDAMDMGAPYGAIIYKSREKNSYSDIKIRKTVTNVNSDNDFIIATQQKKENDPLRYYIIDKYSDTVYGPFKKEAYDQKRLELYVPKNLILEN